MAKNRELQNHIDEVAKLISEYKLSEASLEVEDFKIVLRKQRTPMMGASQMQPMMVESAVSEVEFEENQVVAAPVVNHGTPISSPMMGIYYGASGPGSPPYVSEGDTVIAGQVIGLIEAMKVFNEIHSSVSGTVKKIAAETGQLVNPGDPLMFIG